uniref:Protein phosphatase 2C, putative n=1 Tax=Entamoeba invadens TaxID=33085 RepID=S0AZX6_ENTIV|nr:protein phosphatase 2C, putative [Entamoeba invadens]
MDKGKLAKMDIGFYEACGPRPQMEDAHVIIPDLNKQYKIKGDQMALFAIFDGHGGKEAAQVAQEVFPEILVKENDFKLANYEKALYSAFLKTDQEVLKRSEAERWNNGCTACVVLLVGKRLYTANLGDAEAVLGVTEPKEKGCKPMPLSTKHNPTDDAEKKRIEEAGGQVVCGRINGILAISRSFGDIEFKYPHNKSMKDFVSPIPALQMTPIGKNNPFLILTCDGLYEKMNYEELITLTYESIEKHKKKEFDAVAKDMVEESLKKGSMDNHTAIVVFFKWK